MSDQPEVPPFSPLQPEPPGIPNLTGLNPAKSTGRPKYRQRINYAIFDPALQRRSLSFALTPRRSNTGSPYNALTNSSIEQRAGSEPTTGWYRQNTEVNTRLISVPPSLEGAPWSRRNRILYLERSSTPVGKVLETTEAEGDPIAALDQANKDSQRIIMREIDARIAVEDKMAKLQRRNDLLETPYATYTAAMGRLERERDDARQNQRLAEQRVIRLEGELATSERERLYPNGNDTQQAADIRDLQDERDGLELERNHYMDLADKRLTENQLLQDQVTRLNLQLQAPQASAAPPPVDPAPIVSPDYAPPSFSPLSAVPPPIKPPPSSAHGSPPPIAQRHSSIDNDAALPTNAVRGNRGGRGRGAARGRAGRRGRGAGTVTREKRERACKVTKNYRV